MTLRSRVQKSLGLTPLRAGTLDALDKHYGPGAHPSGSGQEVHGGGGRTLVGITSSRPKEEAPERTSRVVFQQMHEFEGRLRGIQTVRNVRVEPGLGAWEGGGEPTWVVSYRGNGEAHRLLAETGKRYNQEAVLVMYPRNKGGENSPVNEIAFSEALTPRRREQIHAMLVGLGFGGWTWFRHAGKSVLRLAFIPHYAGDNIPDADSHRQKVWEVLAGLRQIGMRTSMREQTAGVELMTREGENSYDANL